jgi:type II restriction enzyme
MKLGFEEAQTPYDSGSQSARFWTEQWVGEQVFCPNCGHVRVSRFKANKPVADFFCMSCNEEYELKSQKAKFGAKVVDGAFRTMSARLAQSNNPNLFLLNYDAAKLEVINLFVVPKHFFVQELIEERPPLAPTARRAGWVGCNIRLDRVPSVGKIFIVRDRRIEDRDAVLAQWQQTLFLREQSLDARGWLIEVMRCVEAIGQREFELDDVYAFEAHLSGVYPNNRHIREKIRQQLQVLRDRGYLDFVQRGSYRLRTEPAR